MFIRIEEIALDQQDLGLREGLCETPYPMSSIISTGGNEPV